MVPEQLKFLVRKLLVIISRVARLLEIMVGVAPPISSNYTLTLSISSILYVKTFRLIFSALHNLYYVCSVSTSPLFTSIT